MKVVFFTNTYLPISYGSVTSIENFRRGLEELGHEVHVVTPRFKGYRDEESRVYRWPSLMYGYKIKYPLALPFHAGIRNYLIKSQPDIVHSHQPFSVGAAGLRLGRKLGMPVVFTHHCRYEDYLHYIPPVVPHMPIKRYVKRQATAFANKCDYVITPSTSIAELIKSRGVSGRIKVLPTGIECERFHNGNRSKFRSKLGILRDDVVLVNSGRIDEEKNISFLVEAVIPILKARHRVKMVFVGEGSLRSRVEARAEKEGLKSQIIMAGIVPQKEVQHYYSIGDIFVQASLTETQGMSLLEALASGLAVVAVKATGSIDQIEHGKTGLLVEHDKKVFRSAVENLIKNPARAKELGEAGRRYAQTCDYRTRAKELVKIYNSARQEHKQNRVFE